MDGGSRLNWTASSTGDYFVEIKSYNQDSQTGGYILSVESALGNSVSGFYSGTINSFEDTSTAVLELDISESDGAVSGYLTLYEPHIGSGTLDFTSYSEGVLYFSVFASSQGVPYVCDYYGDVYPGDGLIFGDYNCFHTDGTVLYESGQWEASR